jgi:hypothetical protein
VKDKGIPISFSVDSCRMRYLLPAFKISSGDLAEAWGRLVPISPLDSLSPSQGQSRPLFTPHPTPERILLKSGDPQNEERGRPKDLIGRHKRCRPLAFPETGPLALKAAEPEAGPPCQSPVYPLRQLFPRNITDQETGPVIPAGGDSRYRKIVSLRTVSGKVSKRS